MGKGKEGGWEGVYSCAHVCGPPTQRHVGFLDKQMTFN